MDANHPLADPIGLIRSLDSDTIRTRLDEIEREGQALRVLLRSARARETRRARTSRPAADRQETDHVVS